MAWDALLEARQRALRIRAAIIGVLGLGLLNGALLAGALLPTGAADDDALVLRTSTEAAPDAAIDAIGAWLDTEAETGAFPDPDDYAGACPSPSGTLCSSLVDDLGPTQVHRLGVSATDWGVDVLLKQTGSAWSVAAVTPWPDLGDRYDGPPWSPVTAITTWWTEDDRAGSMYGSGAVHLPSCEVATTADDQPLLCSTLVEDGDATRTYDSGRIGAPPDVRLTVTRQADGTWLVTDTLVH